MRRASVEQIEKLYQSKADQARERRVSLTIMNCIWARNTERETTHPVHGEVVGKLLYYMFVYLYLNQGGRLHAIWSYKEQWYKEPALRF